jgi:hypothetical protein
MSKESDDPDRAANGTGEGSSTDAEGRARKTLALIAIAGFGGGALGAMNVTLREYLGLQSVFAKLLLTAALTAVIYGPALLWFKKKKW